MCSLLLKELYRHYNDIAQNSIHIVVTVYNQLIVNGQGN